MGHPCLGKVDSVRITTSTFPASMAYWSLFTAFLSPILSRLYGQSMGTPGFGWQAVATDGDDEIEMTEGR
jgi:hypothetical protein